jgi:Peptidase A4 family
MHGTMVRNNRLRLTGAALIIVVLVAAAGVAYASRAEHGTFAQSKASGEDSTAIQQVIQQSDTEQVQAIANQDASSMSDTSTPQDSQQMSNCLGCQGVTGLQEVCVRRTGQNFQTSGQYASSHSSAEWIEEAPNAGRGGILPIDTFGTVSFSGATATQDGQQVNLAQTQPQAINLETQGGQALAVPSAIGADGQSFSVTRTDVPDTQPAGRRSRP